MRVKTYSICILPMDILDETKLIIRYFIIITIRINIYHIFVFYLSGNLKYLMHSPKGSRKGSPMHSPWRDPAQSLLC